MTGISIIGTASCADYNSRAKENGRLRNRDGGVGGCLRIAYISESRDREGNTRRSLTNPWRVAVVHLPDGSDVEVHPDRLDAPGEQPDDE
jgi:hypothetical protein